MLRVKAVLVCYAQVNSRVWETHPNPRHGGRNPVLGQGLKSTDGDVGSGLDLHRLFCCAGYRCQRSRDHRCPVDTGSHRSGGRLSGSRIARAPVINRGRFCKISISGPGGFGTLDADRPLAKEIEEVAKVARPLHLEEIPV